MDFFRKILAKSKKKSIFFQPEKMAGKKMANWSVEINFGGGGREKCPGFLVLFFEKIILAGAITQSAQTYVLLPNLFYWLYGKRVWELWVTTESIHMSEHAGHPRVTMSDLGMGASPNAASGARSVQQVWQHHGNSMEIYMENDAALNYIMFLIRQTHCFS